VNGKFDNSISYIKPEVVAELLKSIVQLNAAFSTVSLSTKLFGFYLSHFDTLTPSQCFKRCANNARCAGASFTSDFRFRHNCYMHKSEQLTIIDKAEGIDLWTTYRKTGPGFQTMATLPEDLDIETTTSTTMRYICIM
jgi:hypothetical protein